MEEMEEYERYEMPSYGVRPWYVIIFGLISFACLVMGIVTDATEEGRIGLEINTWLLSAITLMIASFGAAMISALVTIARRR